MLGNQFLRGDDTIVEASQFTDNLRLESRPSILQINAHFSDTILEIKLISEHS